MTHYILEIGSSADPDCNYMRKCRASSPDGAKVVAARQLEFDRRYRNAHTTFDWWALYHARHEGEKLNPMARGRAGR